MSRYTRHVLSSSSCVPMPTTSPSSMTTILSASIIVPILCATISVVAPDISSLRVSLSVLSVL